MTERELIKIQRRIALNIQRERKKKGLSQEDMSTRGFNYRYYQEVESGRANPTVATLARIAYVLKVDILVFFEKD